MCLFVIISDLSVKYILIDNKFNFYWDCNKLWMGEGL